MQIEFLDQNECHKLYFYQYTHYSLKKKRNRGFEIGLAIVEQNGESATCCSEVHGRHHRTFTVFTP